MTDSIFVQISDISGDAGNANHKNWIAIRRTNFSVEKSVDMNDIGSSQWTHSRTEFGLVEINSGGIPEEAWAIAYARIEHEYKHVDRTNGKLVRVIVAEQRLIAPSLIWR